ncbi:MAG: hypothetical protein CM15mP74_10810 [Halieaceae bacterium]|nr:MAG: hypothetical protein CM15mP74_10810 [Halieaceae bacterium]
MRRCCSLILSRRRYRWQLKTVPYTSGLDRVLMLRADLLSALRSGSADVVLANPPYVSQGEMAELPPEYAMSHG